MARRSLVSQALEYLEAGHISAEEALRAALQGPTAFQRLVERAPRDTWRRPTVRRIRWIPETVSGEAVRRVRNRLAQDRAVLSVHWGVRHVRGRRTNDCAVVVHVRKKVPAKALPAMKVKGAPARVVVTYRGRRFTVPVDVQAVKVPARLHTDFLSPGDHGAIAANGEHIGSLGAVATGASGHFAITAGHVAALVGAAGAECVDDDAGTFALGTVRRNCFADGLDIAAIGPFNPVPDGAALEETAVRDPVRGDVHRRVSLRLPGLFTPVESHVDDVGVTRSFATPAGNITMAGLTAIVRVTDGGDSGSTAIDEQGTVIGFVIGGDSTHTYLLPARRALDALEDSF